MTSSSSPPSVGLSSPMSVVEWSGGASRGGTPITTSSTASSRLPAEIFTAFCVALQHIRAYKTLATLMRVSFDLYMIAGPKLYQRLTLDKDKKRIKALLGPLGMLKANLPGNTGIKAAWKELAFYPIGKDIVHQTLPSLWHVDWETAESYSLTRLATLTRDSIRRRLALLARTQEIDWHYTALQELLRHPHNNELPIFRSVAHLSLNYDTVRNSPYYKYKPHDKRRAMAFCDDPEPDFPGSLMRSGYNIYGDYRSPTPSPSRRSSTIISSRKSSNE